MYYGTSIMDNELVYLNTLQEKTNLILDSEIFIQSLNESEDSKNSGNWLSKIFKFIKDKIMVVIKAIKKAFAFVVEKITGKRKKNKEENKDDIDLLQLDKYELKPGTEFDKYESKYYAMKAQKASSLSTDVHLFKYKNIYLTSIFFIISLNKIYIESKNCHIVDEDIEIAKSKLYEELENRYRFTFEEFKNDINFTNLEEFKEVINNPDIVSTGEIYVRRIFNDKLIDNDGMVKRSYEWYDKGKERIEKILEKLNENYNNIDIDPDINDLGVKDPEELSNFKKLIAFYSKLYIEAIAIVNALSLNCIKCLDLENQELEKLTKWFKSKLVLKKA